MKHLKRINEMDKYTSLLNDVFCDIEDDFPDISVSVSEHHRMKGRVVIRSINHGTGSWAGVRKKISLSKILPVIYSKIQYLNEEGLDKTLCDFMLIYHSGSSPLEKTYHLDIDDISSYQKIVPYDVQYGTYRIDFYWT